MRKRKLITLEGVCNGKSEASIDGDNERPGAVATAEEEEAQVCEAESVALGCDQVATKRTAKRRVRRSAAAGVSRLMTATHGAMQRTRRRLSAVIAELRSLQLAIR